MKEKLSSSHWLTCQHGLNNKGWVSITLKVKVCSTELAKIYVICDYSSIKFYNHLKCQFNVNNVKKSL